MDIKSTWIPTWHQLDHVLWSLGLFFKHHLLEVGLTQSREITALRTFTTVDLFYVIICEEPTWIKTHWNNIKLRAWSQMASHYTWGSLTTLHDFEGHWDRLWTLFWALTISWSRLLARVQSGPKVAPMATTHSQCTVPTNRTRYEGHGESWIRLNTMTMTKPRNQTNVISYMHAFVCEIGLCNVVHSKLHSITPVATKVHVVLRSFIVLTWMHDTIELVQHVAL